MTSLRNNALITSAVVSLLTAIASSSAVADLVVHFDPNVLSSQFSDGSTGGGSVAAVLGDTVGFVTDVRSPTPGAPNDTWHDAEGSGSTPADNPVIIAHPTQGTVWDFNGNQKLLGRRGDSGNTDGIETALDVNTITAIVVGRIDNAASGNEYLFDFRDDAGDLSNEDNGFAIRYNSSAGMLEGLSNQEVNASVALPTNAWFVATYAWDGGSSSATLTVETLAGTASDTGAAGSVALEHDRWRPGARADGNGGTRFYGDMGDLMIYNDVLDHSDVADALADAYIPATDRPVLVDRTTGQILITNKTLDSLEIDAYRVISGGSSLDTGSWNSLDAQSFDGDIWTELDTTSSLLSEGSFGESSTIAPDQSIDLGLAYDTAVDAQDLVLEVHVAGAGATQFLPLGINYASSVIGDMNGDGVVDTADVNPFVQALTNRAAYEGEAYAVDYPELIGDVNGDDAFNLGDVAAFKALVSGGGAASAESVPEPTSLLMVVIGAVGAMLFRTRRPWACR